MMLHLLSLFSFNSHIKNVPRKYIGNVFPLGIYQYLLYMCFEPLVMNLDICEGPWIYEHESKAYVSFLQAV